MPTPACSALSKALVHADKTEIPKWAEPLAKPHIAVGLSRWMANAFSHGLPRLYALNAAGEPTTAPSRLPPKSTDKGRRYWLHFEWLQDEAKQRQKEARAKGL